MTYAAVPTKTTGDSAPASDWNTYVKDNFAHFATHNHDGSSGSGSAALAPNTVLFTDKADEGAPASGKTILWTNSGKLHQITNGGSAEEFSVVGHTHTITQRYEVSSHFLSTQSQTWPGGDGTPEDISRATYTTLRTETRTPTSADAMVAAVAGVLAHNSHVSLAKIFYIQLTIDTVQKFEKSGSINDGGGTDWGFSLMDVYSESGNTGATVWDLDHKSEDSTCPVNQSWLGLVEMEL